MARDGSGQFQFTVVELLVLAVSFAVTSLFVFLLGFYVGRETGRQHLPAGARVARVPVGLPPAPATGARLSVPKASVPQAEVHTGRPATRQGRAEGTRGPTGVVGAVRPPGSGSEGETREETRDDGPTVPYTVQVLATRNRREADSLVAELKRRGVGAFVTVVEGDAGKWYRVRIGRYDDLRSAKMMADRCRRDLGLTQAYVSAYRNDP